MLESRGTEHGPVPSSREHVVKDVDCVPGGTFTWGVQILRSPNLLFI